MKGVAASVRTYIYSHSYTLIIPAAHARRGSHTCILLLTNILGGKLEGLEEELPCLPPPVDRTMPVVVFQGNLTIHDNGYSLKFWAKGLL